MDEQQTYHVVFDNKPLIKDVYDFDSNFAVELLKSEDN